MIHLGSSKLTLQDTISCLDSTEETNDRRWVQTSTKLQLYLCWRLRGSEWRPDRSALTAPPLPGPFPLPSTSAASGNWRVTARGAVVQSETSQPKCQTRSTRANKAPLLSRRGCRGCEGRSSVSHLVKRRLRQLAGSLARRLCKHTGRGDEVIQPQGGCWPLETKPSQTRRGLFNLNNSYLSDLSQVIQE